MQPIGWTRDLLVPGPEIEPAPPAVEALSLNHFIIYFLFYLLIYFWLYCYCVLASHCSGFFCSGIQVLGFPGGLDGKASVCNARDQGSIPGLRRSPGEGNGSPL